MIYIPSASYCPEADWDQILQTTKTRLDALDTPYAIGRQTDLPQSLAIRMPTERIGDATLPLFTSPQPLKLIAGLYDYELNVKEGTLTYDPDVRSDGGIVLDLSEVNKEAFYELTLPLAEQGGGELALTWDNIPFFSTWIDAPITDGILILDRDCHNKREAGLSLTEDWLLKLLETVYREEPLPTELALQFAGFYDEEDNIILTDCYAPSYESFLSAYQEQIAGSYPGSELSCGEDGRLKLMLNLPVDEKLPEAAANAITDICGQINFTASPFSSLTVYPIDTMAGETAEIYVIKEYVYHTLLIYGTISGGRLSQQAELWQTAIEQLPLYTQYRSDLLTWEIY